jgi:ribosomal protein S18 acetylase RimI-like enzyme
MTAIYRRSSGIYLAWTAPRAARVLAQPSPILRSRPNVRRIDLTRALLVGAVHRTDGLVALAEAQPTTSPLQVEMAISVHVPYQRRGLGGHLVTRTMHDAFSRGVEVAEFLFARDNQAVVGLVRAIGGHFTALDRAELRAPNTGALRNTT